MKKNLSVKLIFELVVVWDLDGFKKNYFSLDRTDSLVVMVNYPSEKMCASRRTSL